VVDSIFLTDTRREVLEGTTDLEGNALAVQKSRIRARARMALDELQEVAQSTEIENETVFDSSELRMLLMYVLWDPANISGGGVVGGDPDSDAHVDVADEHQQYQTELYAKLNGVLRKYHQPESGFIDE